MGLSRLISLIHARNLHLLLLVCIWLLMQSTHNQPSMIELSRSTQLPSSNSVNIYNQSASPQMNATFVQIPSSKFNCSLSSLYTYSQSSDELSQNSPYYLLINSNNSDIINVSINVQYNHITPLINDSKQVSCAAYPCLLQIVNNCEQKLNYYNYFDIISLTISSLEVNVSYYVLCQSSFQGNTYEYGLFLEVFLCTILITVVALYSKAWSIGGAGWEINLPVIIAFNSLLVIGGIVGIFKFQVVNIAVYILSWVFGLAAVWLCTNQLLFLIKCTDILRKQVFRIKSLGIRVLDLFSMVISIGVCMGWQLSNSNWVVNDVIAVSMIVAAIKVLKFTSLKQALICFSATICVELVFVLILTFKIKASYNTAILNIFNNPFQLQFPTINNVYNQKCAWLPVTALIYPGALMSYMRRFDTSRNTKVYIITCVCVFILGSIVWLVISIFSKDSWPFGLIAEPAAIGLISFFAWKRKEIRTIWTGKFYDEQFVHKEGLKTIGQSIQRERDKTQIVYSPELFVGLQVGQEQSSMEYPPPLPRAIQQKKEKPSNELDQSLITSKSSECSNLTKIQLSQINPQNKISGQQVNENLGQPTENNQKLRSKSKFPQAIQKGAK